MTGSIGAACGFSIRPAIAISDAGAILIVPGILDRLACERRRKVEETGDTCDMLRAGIMSRRGNPTMSVFLKEFREFAVRGNVVDMAIGIIIGAAFGKIVSALVADVIMPPIGLLVGNIDFSNLFVNLSNRPVASLEEARAAGVPVIAYGTFINTVIDFLIIAFVIFFIIKQINRLKRVKSEAEAAPPAPNRQEVLLEEIRDLLKGRH